METEPVEALEELYAVFIEERALDGQMYMEPIALLRATSAEVAAARVREAIGPYPGTVHRALPMNSLGQWLIGAFTPLRAQGLRGEIAWCTDGSAPFSLDDYVAGVNRNSA